MYVVMKLLPRRLLDRPQSSLSNYICRQCLIRNYPHLSRQLSATAPVLRNHDNERRSQGFQESNDLLDRSRKEGNDEYSKGDEEKEESELLELNTGLGIMRGEPNALPSIAPAPAIDVRHIRQNPGLYEYNCKIRRYHPKSEYPRQIIDLSARMVALQEANRGVREQRNEVKREMAEIAKTTREPKDRLQGEAGAKEDGGHKGENYLVDDNDLGERSPHGKYYANRMEQLIDRAKKLSERVENAEKLEKTIQQHILWLANKLPNLTSDKTPKETARLVGTVDADPKISSIATIESRTRLPSAPGNLGWPSHTEIGSELGIFDFAAAATTSGWGWYYLVNEAAMLEQALIQYALSIGRQRGWKVVSPPSIVYSHIAAACGYEPRDPGGGQQMYKLQKDDNKPGLSLTGTSEIGLAGMKAKQLLQESDLPLKLMGISRCYRAEAGARGIDTKGLYRVHEFTKVELFAWTMPDERSEEAFSAKHHSHSEVLFDEIMDIQCEILKGLGLSFRILEMPASDLGASASRKQDIEVFFPSRLEKNDGWGEVTSTSNCTDYQSRRLETRIKTKALNKRQLWPHTVNGTAMAIPRVLAAILENGWDDQKRAVRIPKILHQYMGGKEYIAKES